MINAKTQSGKDAVIHKNSYGVLVVTIPAANIKEMAVDVTDAGLVGVLVDHKAKTKTPVTVVVDAATLSAARAMQDEINAAAQALVDAEVAYQDRYNKIANS